MQRNKANILKQIEGRKSKVFVYPGIEQSITLYVNVQISTWLMCAFNVV